MKKLFTIMALVVLANVVSGANDAHAQTWTSDGESASVTMRRGTGYDGRHMLRLRVWCRDGQPSLEVLIAALGIQGDWDDEGTAVSMWFHFPGGAGGLYVGRAFILPGNARTTFSASDTRDILPHLRTNSLVHTRANDSVGEGISWPLTGSRQAIDALACVRGN